MDAGYVTVPEANEIVLRILKIHNQEGKSHYSRILEGAKKGEFGGKKYGSRMYQVRREDIVQYAESCARENRLRDGFDIDLQLGTAFLEEAKTLPMIDSSTAIKLKYYLDSLKEYQIISEDVFQKAQKNLIIRMNLMTLTNI